jgi:hypothetical protein
MQRSDIRAVGDLAGEASSVLTAFVRGMHAGIAGRVFSSIGPSAAPARTIHEACETVAARRRSYRMPPITTCRRR